MREGHETGAPLLDPACGASHLLPRGPQSRDRGGPAAAEPCHQTPRSRCQRQEPAGPPTLRGGSLHQPGSLGDPVWASSPINPETHDWTGSLSPQLHSEQLGVGTACFAPVASTDLAPRRCFVTMCWMGTRMNECIFFISASPVHSAVLGTS